MCNYINEITGDQFCLCWVKKVTFYLSKIKKYFNKENTARYLSKWSKSTNKKLNSTKEWVREREGIKRKSTMEEDKTSI